MGWRFEPGEGLQQAFRRVAMEEIAKVRAGLKARGDDRAKSIHEARQGFKRLRALLRLARPAIAADYAGENRRWRDAGRLLAGSRDATVLRETFDRVLADEAGKFPENDIDVIRSGIVNGMDADEAEIERNVKKVVAGLSGARRELGKLQWPKDIDELFRGLKKSQARLRRNWKRVRDGGAPRALHEWRKRIKDQSAQLRLFRRLIADGPEARREQEKATAELLGEEHDLWLLSKRLSKLKVPSSAVATRDRFLATIEGRRTKLRREALQAGRKFSEEEPKDFAGTVAEAWEMAAKPEPRHRGNGRARS